MKWNVDCIRKFLNIYEQYPLLWNVKDKMYCNSKLKDEVFQRLSKELEENELLHTQNIVYDTQYGKYYDTIYIIGVHTQNIAIR